MPEQRFLPGRFTAADREYIRSRAAAVAPFEGTAGEVHAALGLAHICGRSRSVAIALTLAGVRFERGAPSKRREQSRCPSIRLLVDPRPRRYVIRTAADLRFAAARRVTDAYRNDLAGCECPAPAAVWAPGHERLVVVHSSPACPQFRLET